MDGYTIPEAAELAGVSRRELREAVEGGLVSAVRRDGRWWVEAAEIEDLRLKLAPPPPLGAVEEPDDEVTLLKRELAGLKERVAALEAGEPPPADDDHPMRSALTPLFKNPRR